MFYVILVWGERGRVFDRKRVVGALSSTDYKDPPKTIKKIQKPLDSVYVIENALTDRQTGGLIVHQMQGGYEMANRVYQNISPSIKARDYKETPKVIKKWKRRSEWSGE